LPLFLLAQETPKIPKHQIALAYAGNNFTRPGTVVTHQYQLWHKDKSKTTKRGKLKPRWFKLNTFSRAGFYNHKQNHTAVFLTSGLQFSFIRKKGAFFALGLQTGLQQRFTNEDTYTVSENGEVSRNRFSGNTQWTNGLQTRVGNDFSYKNPNNPFGWYLGSNLLWSLPFGAGILSSSIVELGVFYSLPTK